MPMTANSPSAAALYMPIASDVLDGVRACAAGRVLWYQDLAAKQPELVLQCSSEDLTISAKWLIQYLAGVSCSADSIFNTESLETDHILTHVLTDLNFSDLKPMRGFVESQDGLGSCYAIGVGEKKADRTKCTMIAVAVASQVQKPRLQTEEPWVKILFEEPALRILVTAATENRTMVVIASHVREQLSSRRRQLGGSATALSAPSSQAAAAATMAPLPRRPPPMIYFTRVAPEIDSPPGLERPSPPAADTTTRSDSTAQVNSEERRMRLLRMLDKAAPKECLDNPLLELLKWPGKSNRGTTEEDNKANRKTIQEDIAVN